MTARSIYLCALVALLASSGCCCYGPPGPNQGGACCLCLPKPIVWCGTEHECGPDGCTSCAAPGDCGLLAALKRCKTCGKGCGEIYWGEWISDPPDCCDPCDQCYGQWTGPHGYCNLGPCQRLLAALHGYKYCPKPCCNESCGPLCSKPAMAGCTTCGGTGCATCGGAHGGYIEHIHGPVEMHHHLPPGQSIMTENWDRAPGPKPTPGKPLHKAEQPGQNKLGHSVPMNSRMVRMSH
jgi:hypothetical protein